MPEKIQRKIFGFDIKAAEEDGNRATFKGYASVYGNVDLGGDIVAHGAFKNSIAGKSSVVVLADHSAKVKDVVGFGFDLTEDQNGLFATTEMNLDKEAGREAFAMIKQAQERGYKVGLSIGYTINDYEWNDKEGIRTIKDAELWEYSVVVFPMNPQATVTSVKSLLESGDKTDVALLKRGIENHLRDACGFSKDEAKQFVGSGFRDMREAEEKAKELREAEACAVKELGSLINKQTGE